MPTDVIMPQMGESIIDESGKATASAPAPAVAPPKSQPSPVSQSIGMATTPSIPAPSAPAVASGPATDIVMPQMGESIFEGTVTKWLKQVGDKVTRDEPLFEISTDKVDAEIPAPATGVLKQIMAEAGKTVQVNAVVAVIDES